MSNEMSNQNNKALESLAFVEQAGDAISSLYLTKFNECIQVIRGALSGADGVAPAPAPDEAPGLAPGLEWAMAKCRALQSQGFSHARLDVLLADLQNCLSASRSEP